MSPWFLAARPKTLSAGVVPVLVGSALAFKVQSFHWPIFLACLVGSLALQIASNFINDASDFLRGADTEKRVGPLRMAQAGLLSPKALYLGAGLCFLIASLCGVYLVLQAGLPILAIGVLSMICATAYTAGPFPLAYYGLGDLFVMIFFGLAAVCGTYFSHTLKIDASTFTAAIIVGLQAMGILVVNNTRDIEQDRQVKKMTLCVRLGLMNSKLYYLFLLVLSYLLLIHLAVDLTSWWIALPLLTFPLGLINSKQMLKATKGEHYNQLLASTAKLQIIFGFLFSLSLALS